MARYVRPATGLVMMRGMRSECAKRHALVIAAKPGAADAEMEHDFEGLEEKPADVDRTSLQAVEKEFAACLRG
jgi:hypothetical protein